MRLYIVGSVASGKTTLSRRLSKLLDIECHHLDGLVHIKDKTNKKWGNIRRSNEEIENLFIKILADRKWIVEDAGRKMFESGMIQADQIIYLKPSTQVRRRRIVTRYIKQKLGLEDCLYTPNIRMLKFMFGALENYENGTDDLDMRISSYSNKTVILRTEKDINQFIHSIMKDKNEQLNVIQEGK